MVKTIPRRNPRLVKVPVVFLSDGAHDYAAMDVAVERINLALKVLSSRRDAQHHVTASDVDTLLSCFRGTFAGKSIYEIAIAVINAELDREMGIKFG